MENNWPPTHAKIYMLRKVFYSTKIKQSAKVICRFDRLRTAHSKRQTSHMSIENLSGHPHTWLNSAQVEPGLTSCEDLATALNYATYVPYTIKHLRGETFAIFANHKCFLLNIFLLHNYNTKVGGYGQTVKVFPNNEHCWWTAEIFPQMFNH